MLAPKKTFPNVFLLFLKKLLVGSNSTVPLCQGVKDTVFGRKVMVTVPVEVLVHMGGFPSHRG